MNHSDVLICDGGPEGVAAAISTATLSYRVTGNAVATGEAAGRHAAKVALGHK